MVIAGDSWAAGDAYEAYMGRWSRAVARSFVDWLRPPASAHWLDIGCGTGALTAAICGQAAPASVIACDQSAPFVDHARARFENTPASFVVAAADDLPRRPGGFDVVVSGLVMNFLPDAPGVMASILERLAPGGTVAAYVWDYAGGMEFLDIFWAEAVAADARAAALDERRRFPLCHEAGLPSLFRTAGFGQVEGTALEVPTHFATFDDYWTPFLRGTGPAPGYVATLSAAGRDALRERLRRRLPAAPDGRIRVRARAWAARAVAP